MYEAHSAPRGALEAKYWGDFRKINRQKLPAAREQIGMPPERESTEKKKSGENHRGVGGGAITSGGGRRGRREIHHQLGRLGEPSQ